MKIIIEDVVEGEEEAIIIRCHELDEALLQTIYGIKMQHQKIVGFDKGIIHMIIPNEIYYFEAVDNKIFIYCKEKVYESKLSFMKLKICMHIQTFLELLNLLF